MRLTSLPGAPHLGYCTNIHAGETWAEIRASLDAFVPPIRARVAPDRPFGIGLRLSGIAARALAEPATLAAFRDQLARLDAYVFTLNAFPYGRFHGARVKEQVYLPDWRDPERERFTRCCADILAELLPAGVDGSISTVPGCFKPAAAEPGAIAAICERLGGAVAALVELERRSGRRIALALEPEPCCLLETVDETLAFFETQLLGRASREALARRLGGGLAEAERALRRHLGVCYDVCHAAVEFEAPVPALRRLRAAGIAVPKIQLSAALRVPDMQPARLPALRRLNTGVYLHQVVAAGAGGGPERYADLPLAFAAHARGAARGEWRIHCHVPIHQRELGELASTQAELRATLHALKEDALSAHLEVETYTWDVLPADARGDSKAEAIARELAFVRGELDA